MSNKTYCLVTTPQAPQARNQTIIRGAMKKSLTINDFKEMYLSNLNIKALKIETFKSFDLATVNLNKKEAILKYNSNTKRKKRERRQMNRYYLF